MSVCPLVSSSLSPPPVSSILIAFSPRVLHVSLKGRGWGWGITKGGKGKGKNVCVQNIFHCSFIRLGLSKNIRTLFIWERAHSHNFYYSVLFELFEFIITYCCWCLIVCNLWIKLYHRHVRMYTKNKFYMVFTTICGRSWNVSPQIWGHYCTLLWAMQSALHTSSTSPITFLWRTNPKKTQRM